MNVFDVLVFGFAIAFSLWSGWFVVSRTYRAIRRVTGSPQKKSEKATSCNGSHPSLSLIARRLSSGTIDSLLVFSLARSTYDYDGLGHHALPPWAHTLIIVSVFTYEPFCTAYGATIGQGICGIRVRSIVQHNMRIGLLKAYFRFFLLIVMGPLSLLAYLLNPRGKAIQDRMTDSEMVMLSEMREGGTAAVSSWKAPSKGNITDIPYSSLGFQGAKNMVASSLGLLLLSLLLTAFLFASLWFLGSAAMSINGRTLLLVPAILLILLLVCLWNGLRLFIRSYKFRLVKSHEAGERQLIYLSMFINAPMAFAAVVSILVSWYYFCSATVPL